MTSIGKTAGWIKESDDDSEREFMIEQIISDITEQRNPVEEHIIPTSILKSILNMIKENKKSQDESFAKEMGW